MVVFKLIRMEYYEQMPLDHQRADFHPIILFIIQLQRNFHRQIVAVVMVVAAVVIVDAVDCYSFGYYFECYL